MPIYTKTEFSKLCGFQKSNELSVYQSRGKVVFSGEYVDMDVELNARFLDHREKLLASKGILPPSLKDIPPRVEPSAPEPSPPPPASLPAAKKPVKLDPPKGLKEPKAPERKAINVPAPTIPEGYTAMSQMAMQKDQLDIEKKVIEIKLKKLDHQKKLGELVPTELVRTLFVQHSKSIMSAFHDEADNFLMEISKEAGLTREQLAKMRGKLVLKINQGIENSLKESKKSLQAIVEEYRMLRGVGEHD
jgi:hypothetical protein